MLPSAKHGITEKLGACRLGRRVSQSCRGLKEENCSLRSFEKTYFDIRMITQKVDTENNEFWLFLDVCSVIRSQ